MKLLQNTTEVRRAIELFEEFDEFVLEEVNKEYHAKMATPNACAFSRTWTEDSSMRLNVAVMTFGKQWQMISQKVFRNTLSEDALRNRYKRMCEHTNTNQCKSPINKPSQGDQRCARKFWTSEEDEILLGLESMRSFDQIKDKMPGRSQHGARNRMRRMRNATKK